MTNEEILYSNNEEYLLRKKEVHDLFLEHFKSEPTDYFSSSGRIELLGNHTDHNHGKVLTSAVNLDMLAAVSKRDDNKVVAYSKGYDAMEIDVNDLSLHPAELSKSKGMIRGVLKGMKDLGYRIGGFNLFMNSTVFGGAGVSSSAAFELLFCEVINYYYNEDKANRVDMAKAAQYSEVNYFGKPCGLLDQMAISLGGVNHIDFNDVDNPVISHLEPVLKDFQIVITNTGGDHSNLTTHYADIKDEMRKVANYFGKDYLSEVNEVDFYQELARLNKFVKGRAILRAIHFFDENKRVDLAYEALKKNDVDTFLKCINASGESSYKLLQNCYYGGDKEQGVTLGLTLSKKILRKGAVRVHGGGFAGTILAFVANDNLDRYCKMMRMVFGEKNCVVVNLRSLGATHL